MCHLLTPYRKVHMCTLLQNEEAGLADQLMSTPLDDEDPMFNDGSAFSPRPPRPIGRSISSGDVLAADAAFAASLDNPHSVVPTDDCEHLVPHTCPSCIDTALHHQDEVHSSLGD